LCALVFCAHCLEGTLVQTPPQNKLIAVYKNLYENATNFNADNLPPNSNVNAHYFYVLGIVIIVCKLLDVYAKGVILNKDLID